MNVEIIRTDKYIIAASADYWDMPEYEYDIPADQLEEKIEEVLKFNQRDIKEFSFFLQVFNQYDIEYRDFHDMPYWEKVPAEQIDSSLGPLMEFSTD